MNTLFILMARHESPVIPAETCCRDYFAPLTLPVFLRKVGNGEIDLPVVKMEDSQKGAKMVHLKDLADYIDKRREAASKELRQMRS